MLAAPDPAGGRPRPPDPGWARASLPSTAETWWPTVRAESDSRAAISAFAQPVGEQRQHLALPGGQPGRVAGRRRARAARHPGQPAPAQLGPEPAGHGHRAQPVQDPQRLTGRRGRRRRPAPPPGSTGNRAGPTPRPHRPSRPRSVAGTAAPARRCPDRLPGPPQPVRQLPGEPRLPRRRPRVGGPDAARRPSAPARRPASPVRPAPRPPGTTNWSSRLCVRPARPPCPGGPPWSARHGGRRSGSARPGAGTRLPPGCSVPVSARSASARAPAQSPVASRNRAR